MSDALTMTPEQLQEIRERAEKATPGKFCLTADLENLQFHARTDIPKLLDEITRLEAIRVEQWKVMCHAADELRIYKKALEIACLSSTTLIYSPMGCEAKRIAVDPGYWLEQSREEIAKETE